MKRKSIVLLMASLMALSAVGCGANSAKADETKEEAVEPVEVLGVVEADGVGGVDAPAGGLAHPLLPHQRLLTQLLARAQSGIFDSDVLVRNEA